MTDAPIKTYVLVGKEKQSQRFVASIKAEYEKNRENVVFIDADSAPTMAEVGSKIQPPANVVLAAHGAEDGTFEWQQGQRVSYVDLMKNLPREGIPSIEILSCYGGKAARAEILKYAPNGALLSSATGETAQSWAHSIIESIQETNPNASPADRMLKTLDNFNAKDYVAYKQAIFREQHSARNPPDFNPLDAMPHLLGVGGNPPRVLDLNEQREAMTSGRKTVDDTMWKASVARVQAAFDTKNRLLNTDTKSMEFFQGDAAAEAALDAKIADVAKMVREGKSLLVQGDKIATAENIRIANALTVAYLDEAGEIPKAQSKRAFMEGQTAAVSSSAAVAPPSPSSQQVDDLNQTLQNAKTGEAILAAMGIPKDAKEHPEEATEAVRKVGKLLQDAPPDKQKAFAAQLKKSVTDLPEGDPLKKDLATLSDQLTQLVTAPAPQQVQQAQRISASAGQPANHELEELSKLHFKDKEKEEAYQKLLQAQRERLRMEKEQPILAGVIGFLKNFFGIKEETPHDFVEKNKDALTPESRVMYQVVGSVPSPQPVTLSASVANGQDLMHRAVANLGFGENQWSEAVDLAARVISDRHGSKDAPPIPKEGLAARATDLEARILMSDGGKLTPEAEAVLKAIKANTSISLDGHVRPEEFAAAKQAMQTPNVAARPALVLWG